MMNHMNSNNVDSMMIMSNVDLSQKDSNARFKYLCNDKMCYDSSYAPMLIAMLMTMLMAMFLAIAGRSSLGYRVVPKSTLFRVSLCSSEPYR